VPDEIVRFGVFEANFQAGELRKAGMRVRIQDQPMLVLKTLLRRPGELVTREELQQQLWPDVASLDFEHGLNMAVKKLRAALSDSAETPRYIETLARKGYRFIAPLATPETAPDVPTVAAAAPVTIPFFKRWKVPALYLLGGISVLLASAAFLHREQPPARITPLISGSDKIQGIWYSPDGKELIYAAQADGGRKKLFVKGMGIAPARRLTDDDDPSHNEFGPAWAPDGSGITYLRWSSNTNDALFEVPENGGAPRKLMDLGQTSGYGWAPDGKSLLVARGTKGIHRLYLADGRDEQLTKPPTQLANTNGKPQSDGTPRFSPDGKWIAFQRLAGNGMVYMVIPERGGQARQLTPDSFHPFSYDWTPEGDIIFAARGDKPFDSLYRVSVSGGMPVELPFSPPNGGMGNVAVARGGGSGAMRLAYSIQSLRNNIKRYRLRSGVAPVAEQIVAQSPHTQSSPDFAPDGQRFAFASDRSGNLEIYTADRDGGHTVQLTSFGKGMAGWPRWSRDGKRIAFDARPNGHAQVFVIDAEGGKPMPLTPATSDASAPAWSPDGAWIYYTLQDSKGGADIWKVASSGGPAARVTTFGAAGCVPSWDGSQLYAMNVARTNIFAVPLSGGPAVPMTALAGAIPATMAVTETGIYFLVKDGSTHFRLLMYYSFEKGTVERLLTLPVRANPPAISVSRDGSEMLLAEDEGMMSQVMLVENLR
jgi:Tol biopolymer transport system component/DNA-binding winged helix-turn-helix (wHTH) protein